MPAPIRILFTIPNFITAGSGQALLNVVQRLDRTRFEPSICVLRTGGRLESHIRDLGIPLLELPFTVAPRPLTSLPRRIWHAAQPFRKYRFVLWHSYHYSDDYTEPLIARMSGAHRWIYTKKNMSWGSRAWQLRTMFASRIAAQNTAMLTLFFNQPRRKAKTSLLPRGVDTEQFHPRVPPRLGIRRQLNLTPDTLLINCVAHLVPVKGHPTLIRAMAALPDAYLVVAGKPLNEPYTQALKQLAGELRLDHRIHFLGDVQDIPALHAESDIFVLPTLGKLRMEGCPVALLEAMACGLPCIATNIPGSQDVIEDEINGLLVSPEDEGALMNALKRLASATDERQRLGKAANQRIRAHYTIEREVAAHERLYSALYPTLLPNELTY